MKIEKVHNGIRYRLSNDNLYIGDKVFPIGGGRCTEDGWILHDLDFSNSTSGFPDEPHTILDLHHSDYKPYQVRTNYGYSPIECYYKIIKKEQHVEIEKHSLITYEWQEI